MTTSTEQKINLNNCTHEALFKAITRIDAKIATTSWRDKDRVSYSIRHVAALAEHYVLSEATMSVQPDLVIRSLKTGYQVNSELTDLTGRRRRSQVASYLLVLTPALIRDNNRAYSRQCQGPRSTYCLRAFRPSTRTSSVILHHFIWRLNQRSTILLEKR